MATATDNLPPGLQGLSTTEADRRRAAGQGNDVEIKAGRTYGRIVRDNVFNFINNLFYFLGILLLILGKPLDAFAVVFVIAANTIISLFQEIRAKRVMDKMAILMRPKADVLRDGRLVELDPAQVVQGDVLRLEPGDQVVVDGPMVGEGRMEVDESLLTGESDLVTKHPGDELMSGSFCMTGGGYYEARAVGLDSFANKLTAKAKVFKRELTPLQRQVVQIVRILLIVVIAFETLVWVRNVIVDVPFVESVRMSTVILALIPNGLVLSIALTYALGAVRLLGKDVLVQQFNAIESLSNVDVLCTDKTGTLTSGVVTFEELVPLTAGGADRRRPVADSAGDAAPGAGGDAARRLRRQHDGREPDDRGAPHITSGGARIGRARGLLQLGAQVERPRLRGRRRAGHLRARRAGGAGAGARRRRGGGVARAGGRLGGARPARGAVRRAGRRSRVRGRPRRPARPARGPPRPRAHLLQRRAARGRA